MHTGGGGGIKVYPPSEIFAKLVNENAINAPPKNCDGKAKNEGNRWKPPAHACLFVRDKEERMNETFRSG